MPPPRKYGRVQGGFSLLLIQPRKQLRPSPDQFEDPDLRVMVRHDVLVDVDRKRIAASDITRLETPSEPLDTLSRSPMGKTVGYNTAA